MNENKVGKPAQTIWRYPEILEQLSEDRPFLEIAEFSDNLSVELYKPVGEDTQMPHTRDELYIVASGSGLFTLEKDEFPFAKGDVIFVPAQAEHRFSSFSDDFSTWVIFFGPEKPVA
ncbi:MAG: cupin domain-containing protein [Woeseiaceae bacterium]|nr:cupin domain-containing protein [Woeseiaceae bacterium]